MHQILKNFIPAARLFAKSMGEHCEVLIHDFTSPADSVLYSKNNISDGLRVGEEITEQFFQETMFSWKFSDDVSTNHLIEAEDGKVIKSSAALIRDERDKVIGALCIHMDITHMSMVMSQFVDMMGMEDVAPPSQNQTDLNIQELIEDIINNTIRNLDVDYLKREQKIDLIQEMNRKGLFLIKGSVDKVAEKMKISKVTVYSYLDEIKKSN